MFYWFCVNHLLLAHRCALWLSDGTLLSKCVCHYGFIMRKASFVTMGWGWRLLLLLWIGTAIGGEELRRHRLHSGSRYTLMMEHILELVILLLRWGSLFAIRAPLLRLSFFFDNFRHAIECLLGAASNFNSLLLRLQIDILILQIVLDQLLVTIITICLKIHVVNLVRLLFYSWFLLLGLGFDTHFYWSLLFTLKIKYKLDCLWRLKIKYI